MITLDAHALDRYLTGLLAGSIAIAMLWSTYRAKPSKRLFFLLAVGWLLWPLTMAGLVLNGLLYFVDWLMGELRRVGFSPHRTVGEPHDRGRTVGIVIEFDVDGEAEPATPTGEAAPEEPRPDK